MDTAAELARLVEIKREAIEALTNWAVDCIRAGSSSSETLSGLYLACCAYKTSFELLAKRTAEAAAAKLPEDMN